MFEGFLIFQSFFFVFCRDRMFVLLIVIFGTRCLCCLSLHFHMFLSVFLTFSWHFLDISWAFSWHSWYCCEFSQGSIHSKAFSSCFAGTGCLCCWLLHFHYFFTFPWHFLGISLAFSGHILGICLVLLWVFSGFLYESHHFLRIPYISRPLPRVLDGLDACAVYCCISMHFLTFL